MKKNKNKVWIIIAVALDAIITIALLVISIIMLTQTVGKTAAEIRNATGFIGYLQNHTTFYFCLFVLPLFILLAANIIGLVIFVRKTSKAEPVQMSELSEEQKEALRKQILKDMNSSTTTTDTEDPTTSSEPEAQKTESPAPSKPTLSEEEKEQLKREYLEQLKKETEDNNKKE